MVMFYWTSEEAIRYNSIASFAGSAVHIAVQLGYILWPLLRRCGAGAQYSCRMNERILCMAALLGTLAFYVITFPYPFLSTKIRYQEIESDENSKLARTCFTRPGTDVVYDSAGCPVTYGWCESTPAINPYVYLISSTFLQGLAAQMSFISLDSLFSKVLGPIKQVVSLKEEVPGLHARSLRGWRWNRQHLWSHYDHVRYRTKQPCLGLCMNPAASK